MRFDLFLNFDGDCRQALDFYAAVFQTDVEDLMTYSQTPPSPDYSISPNDADRLMYACLPIHGCNVMFMDVPSGAGVTVGNNISLTLGFPDADEQRRVFDALREGGEILMPLEKTFFSELFGMVADKYGKIWQLSKATEKSFDLYFNFNGDCRDALDFYAQAFGTAPRELMTYGQAPADPAHPVPVADGDQILYASMPILGSNAMFCDMPSDSQWIAGNDICPTLVFDDETSLRRAFDALQVGGVAEPPPSKTFFAELYAMVTDKFNVIWQLLLN